MINEYSYTQVLGIFKYIPIEELKKVPEAIIDEIIDKSNHNHSFEFNPELKFEEQGITSEAKEIISILYNVYWSKEKKKETESKNEFISLNKLFENKNNIKLEYNIEQEVKSLATIKKENILTLLINKIKEILHIC